MLIYQLSLFCPSVPYIIVLRYVCTYIIKVGGVTGNVFVDDTPNSSSSQCNNNANELMTGMCMHTLHIYIGNN